MSETESEYEPGSGSDSVAEGNVPRSSRRENRSGDHRREEPTSLARLQACPLAMDCFRFLSCFRFCEMVVQTRPHRELARLFVLHLRGDRVNLAGVDFIVSPLTIAQATGIPNIGEEWSKGKQLEKFHYEPYIKTGYVAYLSRVFPFRFLRDEYAPLMRLIIQYFSCEGRYARLFSYHVRLLMHFTRVRMMNIPYFIYRNIEKMVTFVQKKTSPVQQYRSIYHFALIKILVSHQLAEQGITWEDFISRDFFRVPQQPPEAVYDAGEPSHQPDMLEVGHVITPLVQTYQRGHRALFAATRRVLSPREVEGVLPTSSTRRVLSPRDVERVSLSSSVQVQVQDRGKRPMHDEGPSGGRDTDMTVIDVDTGSPSSKLREVIQEQRAENDQLKDQLQKAQWVINYLEQRNKQLEDELTFYEVRQIREDRQWNRKRPGDMTPADRDTVLTRVNIHLEKLLAKANRDKDMLRHMKGHYWARMHVCKARMKIMKRRLRKALQRRKRPNPLRILAEASLTGQDT